MEANKQTDLEVHIVALKYQLQAVLKVQDVKMAHLLRFAILAAEQSVKLHKRHRESK
jgi:hypothetical protein